jgi:hypothetical protein
MDLIIQLTGLTSNEPATVNLGPSSSVTPVSDASIDGGAPNIKATGETASLSGSGVLDIGGPPRWLIEAIGTQRAAAPAASSAIEAGELKDAGAAPTF